MGVIETATHIGGDNQRCFFQKKPLAVAFKQRKERGLS